MINALFISVAQLVSAESMQEYVNNTLTFHEPGAIVEVIVVKPTFSLIRQGGADRVAMAVRNIQGEEFILVNKNHLENSNMDLVLSHEISHIITWRRFGEDVSEHGSKFKEICEIVVQKDKDVFC